MRGVTPLLLASNLKGMAGRRGALRRHGYQSIKWVMKKRKRKEKTALAVTATVSASTAGISLEEAEEVQARSSDPTGVQQQE